MTVRVITFDDNVSSATIPVSAGGGGVECVETGGVNNTSTLFTTQNTGTLFFNQTNTGFVWVVNKANIEVDLVCQSTTRLGPFSPKGGGTLSGDISLTAITLDGTNILSSIAQSYNSVTEQLTITYSTPIPYSNILVDQTSTITGTFSIGSTENLMRSTSLLYETPEFFNSISRANVDFNETYNSASVFHNFAKGSATNVTSSSFGGTATSIGVPSATITFTALNRLASTIQRTLAETMSFTNASDATDIKSISSIAILNPTFFFPVYLGNVTTVESAALTASLLNTSNRFVRSGTFISTPSNQTYNWADTGDATRTERVFAIANRFTNGGSITVRAMAGGFPSIVTRTIQLALGTISGNTENYDIYIVQSGAPGSGSLFIEV